MEKGGCIILFIARVISSSLILYRLSRYLVLDFFTF